MKEEQDESGEEDGCEVIILPMTAFTHTDTHTAVPDSVNTNLSLPPTLKIHL